MLDDEAIRQLATSEGRIITSKDSDFFDSFLLKGIPPRVLLLRLGNISNHELLAQFEARLLIIEQLFKDGAGLVEVFKTKMVRF